MAKQPYRLQTLLEMRERKKKDAEDKLGSTMKALKVEQDRLKEMEKELERMIARREAKKREYAERAMRGEMRAGGAVDANVYIDRLKEQEAMQQTAIEGQKGVVAQREADVAAAREELIKANQDMKALEKHKEKWEEQLKKEAALKEEETLDEIAQTVFLNRQQ